jgi:ribose transport system permease protein
VPTIVALVAAALIWFMLRRMRFGRHVFAVGGNEDAARLVGINVARVRIIIMMVSGTLAATAGVLMVARLASGQPTIGQTWVLPSFAAPILGGTSMSGGVGSVAGTLLGSVVMGELRQGVVMAGLSVYWQDVVIGLTLILAIVLDRFRAYRRRAR